MKSWTNVNEWTNDIPMSFLPFYVWCTANKVSIDKIFEEGNFDTIFNEFIKAMGLTVPPGFKGWCNSQYIHYYECNH